MIRKMKEITVNGYVLKGERAELELFNGTYELRSKGYFVVLCTNDEETAKELAQRYAATWSDVVEDDYMRKKGR